jgi:hypothetical protein
MPTVLPADHFDETRLNDVVIPVSDSVKYLGIVFTANLDKDKLMSPRLGALLSARHKYEHILNDQHIKTQTKIRIFKSLILPIARYGGEIMSNCATPTVRKIQQVLDGILRTIFFLSPNSTVCTIWRDLNIPNVLEYNSGASVRAFLKWSFGSNKCLAALCKNVHVQKRNPQTWALRVLSLTRSAFVSHHPDFVQLSPECWKSASKLKTPVDKIIFTIRFASRKVSRIQPDPTQILLPSLQTSSTLASRPNSGHRPITRSLSKVTPLVFPPVVDNSPADVRLASNCLDSISPARATPNVTTRSRATLLSSTTSLNSDFAHVLTFHMTVFNVLFHVHAHLLLTNH